MVAMDVWSAKRHVLEAFSLNSLGGARATLSIVRLSFFLLGSMNAQGAASLQGSLAAVPVLDGKGPEWSEMVATCHGC